MSAPLFTYTEEYVVPGGAGANDGTSWADAWDITQVAAALASSKRFNFAGAFTPTANLPWTTWGGGSLEMIAFRGWKSDKSGIALTLADAPTLDHSGQGAGDAISGGSYQHYQGLRILNAPGTGLMVSTGDRVRCFLVEASGNGTHGIYSDDYFFAHLCRANNNGGDGIKGDIYSRYTMCETVGNGGYGIYGGTGAALAGCFIRDNADGVRLVNGGSIITSTIDANVGLGVWLLSTTSPVPIIASLLTNNGTYALSPGYTVNADSVGFYNNGSGQVASYLNDSINEFNENPQYVDIANGNYEITNTNLLAVSVPMLGSVNIGAWQGGAASGGGSSFRPRIRPHGV